MGKEGQQKNGKTMGLSSCIFFAFILRFRLVLLLLFYFFLGGGCRGTKRNQHIKKKTKQNNANQKRTVNNATNMQMDKSIFSIFSAFCLSFLFNSFPFFCLCFFFWFALYFFIFFCFFFSFSNLLILGTNNGLVNIILVSVFVKAACGHRMCQDVHGPWQVKKDRLMMHDN